MRQEARTVTHNPERVDLVAEFLHREVGEPEEESRIDAVELLDRLSAYDREDVWWASIAELIDGEDFFILTYDWDEDTPEPTWGLSVLRDQGVIEYEAETFEDVKSEWRAGRE